LICFPYAGVGTAAFRGWPEALSPSIEVCLARLPGRDGRFHEAPFVRMSALVEAMASAVAGALDKPTALFGHSMGAWIAFELARELRRRHGFTPHRLFVSARSAPQIEQSGLRIGELPNAEFVAEVQRRYSGIPKEVLANDDLLQILLPTLRADVMMLERYRYVDEAPLACPVSAFGGCEDREVTPADLRSWQAQGTGPFTLRMFPGDHFFLNGARARLLSAIQEDLRVVD
jgi:medium-chain acyl-[acyl-carrier-protein] hydrolase